MKFFMRVSAVFFTTMMLVSTAVPRIVAAAQPADGLLMALKLRAPVLLCKEAVPVENPEVVERFEKEMLVSLGDRPQVILWLKRSTRFFPHIERVLREKGLPEDLKYLAVAESALRIHAGSPKGAMGVWQLMPQTATKYGLVVDERFDERRNPYLSVFAAAAYLEDLYERFGSWSLALAAYNMGEEGLEAEVLEQGHADYYRLYLPLETQRFVLRILAIKKIIEAPDVYGFDLSAADFYSPDPFATVRISAFADLPIRLIAEAAGTDFKAIKDYNPDIRGYYLAAGTRMVNIPVEGEAGFQVRLAALIESDARIRSQRLYVVRKGDNLSDIAKKFDVPVAALLIWNRIGIDGVIHPGQRLVIFPAVGKGVQGPATIDGADER